MSSILSFVRNQYARKVLGLEYSQQFAKVGLSSRMDCCDFLHIAKYQKTVDNKKLLATKGGVTPTIDKESGKITHLNGIPLK